MLCDDVEGGVGGGGVGGSREGAMWIHRADALRCGQQKLTHHCKAIILQ